MSEGTLAKIIERVERLSPCTVAVVGDLMLDRYLYGSVERISPEAPIPVVKFQSERSVLGGAGNVVANLCGLGADVKCFAQLGGDPAAREVLKLVDAVNGSSRGSVELFPFHKETTTVKTRVIGNGRQQMMRLDHEDILPLDPELENELLSRLAEFAARRLNAVVLSDYGKGMCSFSLCRKVIELCRAHRIPVFVDPKGRDWQRYAGAELVTPNVKELSDAAGLPISNDDDEALVTQAQNIRSSFGLNNLLVTRSEKGSTFVSERECFDEPSQAVDVYDVSGAGDTVIAAVAFFRACGVDWRNCCRLSNAAAKVVIGKAGTYPISYRELKELCLSQAKAHPLSGGHKVLDAAAAVRRVKAWKEQGEKVVFTNGCFDVFHAGHVDSLTRARALGDRLIVGLNSDRSVKKLKGEARPINGELDRAAVLAALECVDVVVIFDEDTPERLLSLIRPDVLAKGGDYRPERIAGAAYAGRVEILPLLPGFSSTSIIDRLRENE
ncbi:MAG: D-glycero-beta-D-manno-heptose 1-phosphate adenylyltransferase [Pyramidobacter piscolens]